MEPTLFSNNVLLTEKLSARHGRLARGDIIVARNPTNPRQFICKRVLGLPGDTVVLHSAISVNPFASAAASHSGVLDRDESAPAVRVRGRPADRLQRDAEDYVNAPATAQQHDDSMAGGADAPDADEEQLVVESMRQRLFRSNVVVVPRGHVWLEGDNAANSSDSRQYGPVPLGLVRSRAVGRVWPPAEMCVF